LRAIQPKISVERGDRAERRDGLRGRAEPLGGAVGRQVAGGGRQKQRADKVGAAALVLLRARLAVLVRADRHVLGAVILGQLAAAQRKRSRGKREQASEELARGGPQARAAKAVQHD